MKRKQLLNVFLVFSLVLVVMSCAGGSIPGMGDMTPKQQASWMNNVYSRQYDLYLDQILKPEVSPAERIQLKNDPSLIKQDMLRTNFEPAEAKLLDAKKNLFFQVHPLLNSYNEYVSSGGIPPVELEYQIVQLINQLLAMTD